MNRKTKTIAVLTIAVLISIVLIGAYSSGLLNQNNSSQQNEGLPSYTGYLIKGTSFLPFLGSDGVPEGWTGQSVRLTFADNKTFIAHEELIANNNIIVNATYTVYYNITQPNIAIDIIKK
jgi:hypothetical protein